jgi:hypothetical protein
MAPRPSTRTDPSRIHERPPDPVEASTTPLERKESAHPHGGPPPPDPHHELTNPAHDPDPTSDSDPYEREPVAPGVPAEQVREDEPQDPDADPEMKRSAMESLRPPADE